MIWGFRTDKLGKCRRCNVLDAQGAVFDMTNHKPTYICEICYKDMFGYNPLTEEKSKKNGILRSMFDE